MDISRLREKLDSSLWFIPGVFVLGSLVAALVVTELDRLLSRTYSGEQLQLAFTGGAEAARSVLSVISGSILTLTALVFSITVLVLQLTSSQYSPRALRTFLRDRPSKLTMGVFLGTFTFALMGLRVVRGTESAAEPFVPAMLVTASFLLALVSLSMFLYYVHHIANAIQASSIITEVASETAEAIDRLFPEEGSDEEPVSPPGSPVQTVRTGEFGVLESASKAALVSLAKKSGACIELLHPIGTFLTSDEPFARVYGSELEDPEKLFDHVEIGSRRTMEQDVSFGIRQLSDIALRALSPSVFDPSTAIQALERERELLRRLGSRSIPSGGHYDEDGELRLVVPQRSWEYYVGTALEQVPHHAAGEPHVTRRLEELKADLLRYLPESRHGAIRTMGGSSSGD